MVFTVGHPSGSIKEATTSCDGVLVNVTGSAVKSLLLTMISIEQQPFQAVCAEGMQAMFRLSELVQPLSAQPIPLMM